MSVSDVGPQNRVGLTLTPPREGRRPPRGEMVRVAIWLLPLSLFLASCGNSTSPGGAAATSPQAQASSQQEPSQGESWSAIARLPDWWSGSWGTAPTGTKAAMEDCCLGNGESLHLTPKYAQMRASAGESERTNPGGSNRNNAASCLPVGVPGLLSHPILFQFLFTPGKVTMLFMDGEVRRINTAKGAVHTPEELRQYPPSGDSIGHWEGETLVVDTVGISPKADIFMSNGIHTTKQTHVEERIHLTAPDTLQIDTTVTDPEIFEQPYRYVRIFQRVPGDFDSGCAENNEDDSSGALDLTPPP